MSSSPNRSRPWSCGCVPLFLLLCAAVGVVAGVVIVQSLSAHESDSSSPMAKITAIVRNVGDTVGVGSGSSAAPAGSDRVTILLLGIDQRPDEAAQHIPSRSDTMILFTVDPTTQRAALISIPRDLVVPVPGHGDQKINTAHFWGESDRPGSGPDLAVATVSAEFGVPIDYYARVDFQGFIKTVDSLGGIVVDVERPILDDEYPTEDYGIHRLYIPAGPQWLDGARALEFARSRHSENDFARQARQRQVILAVAHKATEPAMALKLPSLIGIAQQSIATNVPLTRIPGLVNLVRTIPSQNVMDVGITPDMLVDVNGDGSEFLPNRSAIKRLFDSVFNRPPAPPVSVEVLNGTTREGFAAVTASRLADKGYKIQGVAQADASDHLHTSIVDRSRTRHAGPAIAALLGVPATSVQNAAPQPGTADVTVTLGFDAPEHPGQ